MRTKIIIEGNLDEIDNNIIRKALARALDLKQSAIIKGSNNWNLDVKIGRKIIKIKISKQ